MREISVPRLVLVSMVLALCSSYAIAAHYSQKAFLAISIAYLAISVFSLLYWLTAWLVHGIKRYGAPKFMWGYLIAVLVTGALFGIFYGAKGFRILDAAIGTLGACSLIGIGWLASIYLGVKKSGSGS